MRFLLRVVIFIGLKLWEFFRAWWVGLLVVLGAACFVSAIAWLSNQYLWVEAVLAGIILSFAAFIVIGVMVSGVYENRFRIKAFLKSNWRDAGEIQERWLPKGNINPHDNITDVTVQNER